MSSSSSPHRPRSGSSGNGEDRPRFFDSKAKSMCWAKADTVPGRHPDRWRKDVAGNVVCKRFCNCQGCLCFEYDHIVPFSRGGESTADNCQILQTRVNRYKSDKEKVEPTQLKRYSCDVQFTDNQQWQAQLPLASNLQSSTRSVKQLIFVTTAAPNPVQEAPEQRQVTIPSISNNLGIAKYLVTVATLERRSYHCRLLKFESMSSALRLKTA